MPMSSRAVVQTGVREYEMQEFSVPRIGPEEGLLRVEQSGVCGSDWSQYKNGYPKTVIPGHEPVGIIEEIGEIAARRWNVSIGDRVAVETMLPCGFCRFCINGKYNLCRASGSMIHAYGYRDISEAPALWGGHSELMYLDPHSLVHKIDKELPAELAVMFNPLGAGVRWAHRLPGTGIGDCIVILGCGQRGLASVVAAREAGASQIVVTGLSSDAPKLELARHFGADLAIDIETENLMDAVRDITNGQMADVVVEVTSGATQPVSDSIELAASGGTIVLAGAKYGKVPAFDSNRVLMKELTILGALAVDYDSYEAAIRIIESRRYPLELMHTHTLSLEEADKALLILGNEFEGEYGIHLSLAPNG
ncbi:MAG: zinc-binding dehydrogenase [Pseudomonadales bacterium]|jgi:threonine dehydrogenase-like Zn-dependent dehydrogenase